MQCTRCKNELILIKKKYIMQLGTKTIILENTPMLQCSYCCEEYVENEVTKKIEEIEDTFENINVKLAIIDYEEV